MFQRLQRSLDLQTEVGKKISIHIGVLSLQGCIQPHEPHLKALGATFVEVKTKEDLNQIDGLILPGGESTSILKLIDLFSLETDLMKTFNQVPTWGICAGAILMARKVASPKQKSFKILNITVQRNSYGRQSDSFNTEIDGYCVSFIRAPKINWVGPEIHVLARYNQEPVWVSYGHWMASTFHPELNSNTPSPMHRQFFESVVKHAQSKIGPKKLR